MCIFFLSNSSMPPSFPNVSVILHEGGREKGRKGRERRVDRKRGEERTWGREQTEKGDGGEER